MLLVGRQGLLLQHGILHAFENSVSLQKQVRYKYLEMVISYLPYCFLMGVHLLGAYLHSNNKEVLPCSLRLSSL